MAQSLSILLLVSFSSLAFAASGVRDPLQPGGTLILDKPECGTKRIQQVDKDALRLLAIGKNGRKFPTNRDELKDFCKDTTKYTQSMDNFISDCFDPDAKKIAQIFIFSLKQALKPFCGKKKSKKQQKIMDTASCLNTFVEKISCADDYANVTKTLIPYDIGQEKIKHLCCQYVEGLRCAERIFDQHKCITQDGRDLIFELIRSIGGDIINFGCGDFNDSTDRCDKLPPPPKNKLDKSIKVDKKYKSFFLATIAVVDSMGIEEVQPLS